MSPPSPQVAQVSDTRETILAEPFSERSETERDFSMAFDPEAASKAGTLKIPVSDPDLAGLVMGAIACFGLGIPLLLLVEMQWMFFLWPLRIMALGALAVGVYLSHSALRMIQRKRQKARPGESRKLVVIRELLFWLIAIGVIGALLVALYTRR